MSNPIKVLMVDDEEQFRETTKKILTKRGFETILAASGEEALEKIRLEPDVIILDIKMPGLDGLGTLAELGKVAPQVPVIMLTGHGSEPSAKEALGHGAFDYLAKPCDMDTLASKINEAARWNKSGPRQERSVGEVMIPIEEYTTLNSGATVAEAIQALRRSFQAKSATDQIMETGHRSIMIRDDHGRIIGILAILDLMEAIMPAYLKAPRPVTADSVRYSPLFWTGMFTAEVEELGSKMLDQVMSPAPASIEAERSLMEAAYLMATMQERRLAVTRGEEVVGVIREQELFFEMEAILR